MSRAPDWIALMAVAIGCAVSLVLLPRIPLYRAMIGGLLPATAAAAYLIVRNVGRRSAPHRRREPVLAIAVHAVVFIISLHVLMVSNLVGLEWARALGPRAVVVLFGAVFISTGNLLPRTPPNLAIGIRTRRTLADQRLWSRVHRLGGYTAVALGLAIVAAGLFLRGRAMGAAISLCAIVALASLGIAYWRMSHESDD